ncbi:hypothetical protein [Porphyromonas gingivalis]|uniref:hypothetical protein n=1 Tax=Porphyromonas gingivalis TaxID=837 RepID=UPI001E28AFBB|nr:hypothetical protein [Porphyromonas gingivalis]
MAKKILRTQRAEIMVRVFENLRASFFRFGSRNYFFPNQKQKIAAPRFLVPQMIIFLYVQAYPNYPPDKKFLPPEYRRELLTELLADDTILNDRG